MYIPWVLTTPLWKDIRADFSLEVLQIKAAMNVCERRFPFSEINDQEYSHWVLWYLQV